MAAKGSRLALVARHRDRLEALGVDGLILEQDLVRPKAGDEIVESTVNEFGGIDGIVNVAGEVAFGPLRDCSDEALERLFAVNVLGPLRLIRAAIPHLSSGGFIAEVSAITAEYPTAGMVAYSASKGALTAADRALALELRKVGVSVIDVRPPHMETDLPRHPIEGTAPRLPTGIAPREVAERLVRAIEEDEREVGSRDFSAQPGRPAAGPDRTRSSGPVAG